MTGDGTAAYRCAPDIVWTRDADRTILVGRQRGKSWSLDGPEAAIWDLLALGYRPERIVRFLSVLSAHSWEEARGTLSAVAQGWLDEGIVQEDGGREGSVTLEAGPLPPEVPLCRAQGVPPGSVERMDADEEPDRLDYMIQTPGFRPEFLLTRKLVRLSMAQPCTPGVDRYVHPNQYRAVATKIVDFAQAAIGEGVGLEFGCGFVRCMFSDRELATLRAAGAGAGWRCDPDLDGELEGRDCYRRAGVFRECSTCAFKARGECSGGCLGMTVRRFQGVSFALAVPGAGGGAR